MGILREPGVWIVILVVILLFGAKRLPDVARGVGRSLRIFKAETEGLRSDGSTQVAEPPAVTATPAPPAPVVPAPAAPTVPEGARYLVDPVTGERVLAQPVSPPSDGLPRA
jgi:sec-independent protein translocase protein TatA